MPMFYTISEKALDTPKVYKKQLKVHPSHDTVRLENGQECKICWMCSCHDRDALEVECRRTPIQPRSKGAVK